MTRSSFVAFVMLALFVASGCVGKKKYDAVVQDRDKLKKQLADTRNKFDETKSKLESKISALEDRIAQLEKKKASLEKELKNTKGTLQMYESETGSLEEKLDTTKEQLAKLREQQRQQKERLDRYRQLAQRLADTFKSGQLSVKVRDGKLVIEMSDDVLFDSGQARVNKNGRSVLGQLAKVLKEVKDREFLVAGHTDDVPLGSGHKFEDNWDLSTARAANVVRLLAEKGVSPNGLAAAGYGKHDPIASNETEKGRAKNRRIEIILMPKVEELPSLPKDMFEEG